MIRRAGRFQRSKRPLSPPLPEDCGEVLHRKWLEWVEDESFRRLAFRVFLMDAQTSMTWLVNPLISYAEVSESLPESADLWMAGDAEQWKALYLQRPVRSPGSQLSLTSFLRQRSEPSALEGYHDVHFSNLIVLHGFWRLNWEYSQQLIMLNLRPGDTNAVMDLRYQELCHRLNHFRVGIHAMREPPVPETILVLEALSMYLHMSLDDIKLFAGKEDIEEARRVLPLLQQWIEHSQSRQAVWHAGQVLAAAKSFPPRKLSGFFAITVFYSSLACWAYGLISRFKSVRDQQDVGTTAPDDVSVSLQQQQTQRPRLDGDETPDVQRFVVLGRGSPVIAQADDASEPTELTRLSEPEAVMTVVLSVLKKNFRHMDGEALPPLVENLVQLLQDLSVAAGSVGH